MADNENECPPIRMNEAYAGGAFGEHKYSGRFRNGEWVYKISRIDKKPMAVGERDQVAAVLKNRM